MGDIPPQLPGEPSLPHKDRKAGLIFFGIVEILLGCLTGLLIVLMLFGQFMAAQATHQPVQLRMILPGVVFYAVLGALLITLGIGSIRARRWARALSLILSWAWFITGLISMAFVVFFLPQVLRGIPGPGGQGLPPAAMAVAMTAAIVTIGLFFMVVPGVLVLFYRSPHVRAACEARQPAPCWTDACPLPVLGLSLWLGLTAFGMVTMPLTMNGAIPIFGHLLSGWSGSLVCLALAALWLYCALATYRLNGAAWWIVFVSLGIFCISAWMSFSRIDLIEMYRQMGYSDAQLDLMRQLNVFDSRTMGYLCLSGLLPIVAYLLFVKHFFRKAQI